MNTPIQFRSLYISLRTKLPTVDVKKQVQKYTTVETQNKKVQAIPGCKIEKSYWERPVDRRTRLTLSSFTKPGKEQCTHVCCDLDGFLKIKPSLPLFRGKNEEFIR